MSRDITEELDDYCRDMLGHSNWACADVPIKGMEEHSRETWSGQEVIFYKDSAPEDE